MTYRAPVRDLAFSLRHAADFGRLADAFPEADADTVTGGAGSGRRLRRRRAGLR